MTVLPESGSRRGRGGGCRRRGERRRRRRKGKLEREPSRTVPEEYEEESKQCSPTAMNVFPPEISRRRRSQIPILGHVSFNGYGCGYAYGYGYGYGYLFS
ncbi:hypothetical protein PanWU01x14_323490 [Parasponia andersonii]|uniref:Uncharacterized protein n=1 Tax=Parasponia andersonii TaxID=3476 RepID=A0A2P5AKI0_PARAD|nr:hypothetical protein PanWU01x14_323490 [Parasponia andersonii]